MTAYAIAHLYPQYPQGRPDAEVIDYIDRIQPTMDPYGGRFLVHNSPVEVIEGEWPGGVVVLRFPGMAEARAWYGSPAYQELVPLRTRSMAGDVVFVEGVAPDYDPSATAAALRAAAAGVTPVE
ncbi:MULTISPECIES: DUF1330 domain-containing protein [unclassified Streptomyces]|uniref:DUF1330 domain-containing protein n=1 Tax=unclassified Streptomyces TaxID=2593676 RepID=UPI000DAEE748|nr:MULTISPECIES: DUF1330 domain-containing protein [unclassified Streptomyces]PZT76317.1 DUF1330 domain-containing protein [Streptomyces sp. AC1-42W]PZT79729.1 DUF1330 domain-containing protein [Streptomyces sp. AC1-42T]